MITSDIELFLEIGSSIGIATYVFLIFWGIGIQNRIKNLERKAVGNNAFPYPKG